MAVDVLEQILVQRRVDVARAKTERSISTLEGMAKKNGAPKDFFKAVTKPGRVCLIAEMKKKSPSAGEIRGDYQPAKIAADYQKGGVDAISVLTEPARFEGKIEDIPVARSASSAPILRKDFLFDPYQVIEARAFQADSVLLIADMLEASQLNELLAVSREHGMEPLVEIFTADSLEPTLRSGAKLIGINTRNLKTLEMFPDNVQKLSKQIPADRFVVAESGIKTAADVKALKESRIAAMLVGESILKQKDLAAAVKTLVDAGK